MRKPALFPQLVPVTPEPRVRVFRMWVNDCGDRYRGWTCRICGHEEDEHYAIEPLARWRKPCPVCNDPASPPTTCADCGEALPRRGPKRCLPCARTARAEVFRARWKAAHPEPPPEPLPFPPFQEP